MKVNPFFGALLLYLLCQPSGLWAQEKPEVVPAGIPFEMVARTAFGEVLPNEELRVRVSFLGAGVTPGATLYSETHEVTTDDFGMAAFLIGQGNRGPVSLGDIPWESGQMWLEMDIRAPHRPEYRIAQRVPLKAVPYTFYAASAERIANQAPTPGLRSGPNIRWLTSGNTGTEPPIHYLGSADDADLVFMTNNTERLRIGKEGQMAIKAGPRGPDHLKSSYPLVLEGSNQGLYIEITDLRDNDNNFVTFADNDGVWGAIQGQTESEWLDSGPYLFQDAMFKLRRVSLLAQGIGLAAVAGGLYGAGSAAIASLFFSWAAGGFYAAAAGVTARVVILATEVASHITQEVHWRESNLSSLGVVYSSGSADYAEWLPREAGTPDLSAGSVAGIKNGKVSLETDEADYLLPVSARPAVVGNHPMNEGVKATGETIGFIGQVPVRVVGDVRRGDYLIPSGNKDGNAIAISPDEMTNQDFNKIIGVAWEDGQDRPFKQINTAIGLYQNNALDHFAAMDQKADEIIAYLQGDAPLPDATLPTGPAGSSRPVLSPDRQEIVDQFETLAANHEQVLLDVYRDLEREMKKQKLDPDLIPGLRALLADPINESRRYLTDPGIEIHVPLFEPKVPRTGR